MTKGVLLRMAEGDPTWFVREIRVRELTEGNMYNGARHAPGIRSTEVMPGVQSLASEQSVCRRWPA